MNIKLNDIFFMHSNHCFALMGFKKYSNCVYQTHDDNNKIMFVPDVEHNIIIYNNYQDDTR